MIDILCLVGIRKCRLPLSNEIKYTTFTGFEPAYKLLFSVYLNDLDGIKEDISAAEYASDYLDVSEETLQEKYKSCEHILGANVLQIALSVFPKKLKIETIGLLLENLDPHHKDHKGWTVVHYAAMTGNVIILKEILEYDKILYAEENEHEPFQGDDDQFIKNYEELFEPFEPYQKALDDVTNKGETPLLLLVKNMDKADFTECIQLLITYGADINKCDKYRYSPILMAAIQGNNLLVDIFLQFKNIDLDTFVHNGETARQIIKGKNIASTSHIPFSTPTIQNEFYKLLYSKNEIVFCNFNELDNFIESDNSLVSLLEICCMLNLKKAAKKCLELREIRTLDKSEHLVEIAMKHNSYEVYSILKDRINSYPESYLFTMFDTYGKLKMEFIDEYLLLNNRILNVINDYGNTILVNSILHGNWDDCLFLLKKTRCLFDTFRWNTVLEILPETVLTSFLDSSLARIGHKEIYFNLDVFRSSNKINTMTIDKEIFITLGKSRINHPIVSVLIHLKAYQMRIFPIASVIAYGLLWLSFILWLSEPIEHNTWRGFLIFFLIIQIIIEIFKFKYSSFSFYNINTIAVLCTLLSLLSKLVSEPTSTLVWFDILYIGISSYNLMSVVGKNPGMVVRTNMVKIVIFTYIKLFAWFLIYLIGFAAAFSIIQNPDVKADRQFSLLDSIYWIYVMITGEFEASGLDYKSYPVLSNLLVVALIFIFFFVLSNVLHALALTNIQAIQDEVEKDVQIAQLNSIQNMFSIIFNLKNSKLKRVGEWLETFTSIEKFLHSQVGLYIREDGEGYIRVYPGAKNLAKVDARTVKSIQDIMKAKEEPIELNKECSNFMVCFWFLILNFLYIMGSV